MKITIFRLISILIFMILIIGSLLLVLPIREPDQIVIIYYENGEIEQFNKVKDINQINNETGLYLIKYKENYYGYPKVICNVTNIIIYEI